MGEYSEWQTGNKVVISSLKTFEFPSTGAKVLFKVRPPLARDISTDQMKGRAVIRVAFPGREQAKDALRALKGEEESKGRMSSRVSLEGNELTVEAEGADMVALRAAVNAYLRYLQEIESIEGGKDG